MSDKARKHKLKSRGTSIWFVVKMLYARGVAGITLSKLPRSVDLYKMYCAEMNIDISGIQITKNAAIQKIREIATEFDNSGNLLNGNKAKITPRIKSESFKLNENIPFAKDDDFYRSYEWRRVRYDALLRSNGRCECCGRGPSDGAILNVDHIRPRRRFPELSLTLTNLQVLCEDCNHGKGNRDQTDWRSVAPSDIPDEGETLH